MAAHILTSRRTAPGASSLVPYDDFSRVLGDRRGHKGECASDPPSSEEGEETTGEMALRLLEVLADGGRRGLVRAPGINLNGWPSRWMALVRSRGGQLFIIATHSNVSSALFHFRAHLAPSLLAFGLIDMHAHHQKCVRRLVNPFVLSSEGTSLPALAGIAR